MRIHILAVGRSRAGPERTLLEHYCDRLRPSLTIVEVEVKKVLPNPERIRQEGRLLLGAVPDGAYVIALDERGRAIDSVSFAKRIGDLRNDGTRDLAFMIGGADGLDEAAQSRAGLVMSFGTMTWPHMLVRGMLAEQLYRAQCIGAGHPYHRA